MKAGSWVVGCLMTDQESVNWSFIIHVTAVENFVISAMNNWNKLIFPR